MKKHIVWMLLLLLALPVLACAEVSAGDVNGDGAVNLDDVLALTRYTLAEEAPANAWLTDVNGDGQTAFSDSLYLLRHLCGEALPLSLPTRVVDFEGQFTVKGDAAYVDFGEHVVKDWADVAPFLRQLPNCTRCDMYASVIEKNWIEALAAEFPQIQFGWSMLVAKCHANGHYNGDHIVRTDATAYSTLHYAYGTSPNHTSADFSVLRFCKNLRALDIGHNLVDDLSFLSGLTELRILIVAITYNVTDISPLANLTHLQYLELFNNKIADISPLANLHELLDLNICFNNIQDYTPLYGLTQLERLWIWNSYNVNAYQAVPFEHALGLQRALPNCNINNSATDPTGGYWRFHPRYTIVKRIFDSSVYEPF